MTRLRLDKNDKRLLAVLAVLVVFLATRPPGEAERLLTSWGLTPVQTTQAKK